MKGWQIISYVIQKPAHPSGRIIRRRGWVRRLQQLGDLRAGSAALRTELRWALHPRHCLPPHFIQ